MDKRTRLRAFSNALKLLKAGLTSDNDTIINYLSGTTEAYRLVSWHRGHECYGQIVYEIHEAGNKHGFFAEYRTLLFNLLLADECGLVPCVRYGKDFAYYDEELEELNPFEYYFEAIGGNINVDAARNVVISSLDQVHSIEREEKYDGSHYSESLFSRLVEIEKKYIRIKKEHIMKFDNDMAQIIGVFEQDYSKVLGVHYRGTDYGVGYNLHPVQFTADDLIEIINDVIRIHAFTTVFLATDDEEVISKIQDRLSNVKVLYNRSVFRTTGRVSVAFSENKRELHKFRLGLEVLEDAYFLSKCGGLIGGLSQVTWGARFLKAGHGETYESERIIDKGINKNNRYFK